MPGYELKTSFRFDETGGGWRQRTAQFFAPPAEANSESILLASATYAPAAMLWRINIGWLARKQCQQVGFPIDMDTGRWGKSSQEVSPEADSDGNPNARRAHIEMVIPFVQDRSNPLISSSPSRMTPRHKRACSTP